jgi:hypothetical protein
MPARYSLTQPSPSLAFPKAVGLAHAAAPLVHLPQGSPPVPGPSLVDMKR